MNSSTSSFKVFFLTAALGAVAALALVQYAPESYIHKGPEYGMSEAVRDRIETACKRDHIPLVVVGDSRAVAGVDSAALRAAGYDAEKFALGASGVFIGWDVLHRLEKCGVKIDAVLMAYGTVHMIQPGAIMKRTVDYGFLRGPDAKDAYEVLSQIEPSRARRLAYWAIGHFGDKLTLIDAVLLRVPVKWAMMAPQEVFQRHAGFVKARKDLYESGGDAYYGRLEAANGLPDEKEIDANTARIDPIPLESAKRIAEMSKASGFKAYFYVMPVHEKARAELDPRVFALAEQYRNEIAAMGIEPLNEIWTLPVSDFGDPSHVNARGRAAVTEDLLPRLRAHIAPTLNP